MIETITSFSNEAIKNFVALRLKKQRERQQLFLVEGWKNIHEALEAKFIVEKLLVDVNEHLKTEESLILKNIAERSKVIYTTRSIINKIAETVTAQPLLAVIKYPEHSSAGIVEKKFVVLLNNIQDPGNVGTIIRTAVAAGADAVYYDSGCADRFSAKVIRASAGAVFKIPVIGVEKSSELISKHKRAGFAIIGTALCKDAVSVWDLEKTEKIMIVLGNEGAGIDDELLAMCAKRVVVPLKNNVESLNVGAAAAIVLFAVANK
ncbi:MAG: RNA methyltransferase [Negativicutes bacterium]|jgi:TrmH family RNA methyltransferase